MGSLALLHIRHATPFSIFTHASCNATVRFPACVMQREWVLSCTFTHTSCYATVRSLALPHVRHAMLLGVLLHFHTCVMLCYGAFFCTSAHTSCYPIVRSGALPCICHATVLFLAFTKCVQLIQFQNVPDWSKSEAVAHTHRHTKTGRQNFPTLRK